MISDEAIVSALEERQRTWSERFDADVYVLRDVTLDGSVLDLEVGPGSAALEGSTAVRVRLSLPSSGLPQPWLYRSPAEDADDWVMQLLIALDEEVLTGGLTDDRDRDEIDGRSYVIVEGYGWRVRDSQRHDKLSRLVGPEGWHAERPGWWRRWRHRLDEWRGQDR